MGHAPDPQAWDATSHRQRSAECPRAKGAGPMRQAVGGRDRSAGPRRCREAKNGDPACRERRGRALGPWGAGAQLGLTCWGVGVPSGFERRGGGAPRNRRASSAPAARSRFFYVQETFEAKKWSIFSIGFLSAFPFAAISPLEDAPVAKSDVTMNVRRAPRALNEAAIPA